MPLSNANHTEIIESETPILLNTLCIQVNCSLQFISNHPVRWLLIQATAQYDVYSRTKRRKAMLCLLPQDFRGIITAVTYALSIRVKLQF